MSENASIQSQIERLPMYWEAARYCEEHDLDPQDVEKVRTWLAVTEFRRRCEPYLKAAADLMASVPVRWIQSGDGMVRADIISLEQDRALHLIQDMIDAEAMSLGLIVPARDTRAAESRANEDAKP
jgi:hypothetical protein